MNMKKTCVAFGCILALPLLLAAQGFGNIPKVPKAETKTLTLNDIQPGLPNNLVKFEGVPYKVIGSQEFDDFFKSSAKINGLAILDNAFSDSTTVQLKKLVRTKLANAAVQEASKDITRGKNTDSLTLAEQCAVLKAANAQKQLSSEEKTYLLNTSGYALLLGVSTTKMTGTAQDLLKQGSSLSSKTGSLGSNAPAATDALKSSTKNLNDFVSQASNIAKNLNALGTGLKASL